MHYVVVGMNLLLMEGLSHCTIKLLERKDGTKKSAKVRFEAYKRAALDSQCLNKMAHVYKYAVQNGQIVEGQRWEFEIVTQRTL